MLDPLITTIVAVVVAPGVMSIITYFIQRGTKKLEWERQDEVAKRVATAAVTLEKNTSITTAKLNELQSGQKQIHTLVNSNLTAQMLARKDALMRELVVLREMAAMKTKANDRPFPETLAAIKSAKNSIAELSAQLSDRLAATQKGEAERKAV